MSQGLPLPQNLQNNSLPINALADGNNPNDVLTWDGTEWIAAPSSGGGGIVLGTSNQITANTVGSNTTLSLPNTLIAPGSLSTTTSITDNSNLTVQGSSSLGASLAPTNINLFTASVYYAIGTVIQSGNTITGFGTSFTSDMVGMFLVYGNNVSAGFITAVNSGNSLTVTTSQGVGSQTYKIYNYSLITNSVNNNVSIKNIASPSLFSVMPINNTLTFPGIVSQSANIITGSGTNFTSALLGMHIVYTTGVYGGLITAVSSTTSLTVNTSQTIASTNYIIQYPGFQINSTGQSVVSGKALTTETITTSTTLNSYIDSIIDTTNGPLTCNLGTGIDNQYKVVKLSTNKSSPATISCYSSGGGTFQLTPTDYIRELRYNANVGYWQIEAGVSQTTPVPVSFYPTTQLSRVDTSVGSMTTALSADGNTLAIGIGSSSPYTGGTLIYTRTPGSTTWVQQGSTLLGTGVVGSSSQGFSVALSATGDTLAVGGWRDNDLTGATWIFTRSNGAWTQQGPKLVGTGISDSSYQGYSVALSADGNTVAIGAAIDGFVGATWVFTRIGTTWTQQGNKLVGTGYLGITYQGWSCDLSADGNTLAIGGRTDNSNVGAAWIFTRSGTVWTQQGSKLVGTGGVGSTTQGYSVALSADGNTLAVGGVNDNSNVGATWIFTRASGVWAQQGTKLVGTGAVGASQQGTSCSLSADGNTLSVGGPSDNTSSGAVWIFTRSANVWSQQLPKLVGTKQTIFNQGQGYTLKLSTNGNIIVIGGSNAFWTFG
jgi:hypothetical protein